MIGQEIVGRYRILAKLGEGGMGAVYRAEQISLKRTIALKVLRPELSANKDLIRRFNAEAELAAKLNHPNTVTLYDFGQDEHGTLFIAMEYIEGYSLRDSIIREGPLSLSRLVGISSQICSSLADAHRAGIIHRDLKPDNVMLSERARKRDQVTVLDFGIAKLRDIKGDITQQPMTQVGDMLGTPHYMAPEQIRGKDVEFRTDVYAMGVMLYEMATARLPFDGHTMMALLSKHLTEEPVSPAERRPDLSIHPTLSALIMRCLEKSPRDRPSSMDELEDLLQQISAGAPAQKVSGVEISPSAPAKLGNQQSELGQSNAAQSSYTGGQYAGERPTPGTIASTSVTPNHDSNAHSAYPRHANDGTEAISHGQAPAKRSSWIAPTILVLLAAGGGAAYFMQTRGATKNTSSTANSSFPLETDSVYTDIKFGYTFDVPVGFKGQGNSNGDADFIGEVYGEIQQVHLRAWSANAYASEASIAKDTKLYVSEMLSQTQSTSEWEDIDSLRVFHGFTQNNLAEYMVTHVGSAYYMVIVRGGVIPNAEISRFRTNLFANRIDLQVR